MLKFLLKLAAAPLALLTLTVPVHAADPALGDPGGASSEAALMEMFGKLFDTGDKTPIDPAQLARAQATASKLLPDGAFGKMMDQMIGQFIKPMLKLDESMSGNQIATKTGVDFDKANALSDEQRGAVLAILDPGRNERNEGMFKVMTPLLMEVGKALEAPMREGLARAYARKFTPDQLAAVNAFFATPTGTAFAAESFAIQADPEVLSATFQAIPVMMTKLMGSAGDFEAQAKALPQERKLAELDDKELGELAKILDTSVAALKEYAVSAASEEVSLETMMQAEGAAEEATQAAADAAIASGSDDIEPWFDRANWDPADLAKVEALEARTSQTINAQIEAEEAAVAKARAQMTATKK
ncbi:MAG: DUF2059 domain-containing protein [Sphingopyxis sp.]|nr:DUF2059 domain-containing protein [Sphingopyxis sp.]